MQYQPLLRPCLNLNFNSIIICNFNCNGSMCVVLVSIKFYSN